MRESKIELHYKDQVESAGGMFVKLLPFGAIGIPDRLALLPGGIAKFVEFKAPNKKPRAIQNYVHNKLRHLGFEVLIIDSIGVNIL